MNEREHIKQRTRANGFTIIELTVIIVVIAILAAITIVSYGAVTKNAKKQNLSAAAQQGASLFTKYRADNGRYPDVAGATPLLETISTEASYQYSSVRETDSFCLTVYEGTVAMHLASGTSEAKEGICPGHVLAGQIITNLSTNPTVFNTANWATDGGSLSNTSTPAYSGTSLVYLSSSAGQSAYHSVPAKPNTQYSVSLRHYGGAVCAMEVALEGSPQGGVNGRTPMSGGNWAEVTATAVTGPSATTIRLRIIQTAALSSCTTFIDNVMLTETAAPQQYADGNTEGWSWNGTQNLSSSSGPAL